MNLSELADVSDMDDSVVKGQTVLLRVSFDAFDDRGNIEDGLRIEAAERTLKVLKQKGAKNIILLTYAGRPDKNAVDKIGENAKFTGKLYDKRLSVRPAADFLHGLMKERVHFISALDDNGNFYENASDYIAHVKDYLKDNAEDGDTVLLDNLRFWEGENNGDKASGKEFAKLIASLGTVYVQDGFAQAHRMNNATVGEITKHTKINVMGMQVRAEVDYLKGIFDNLMKEDRKPFVLIVGGKKIETKPGIVSKIDIANKLMQNMKSGDKIMIGGAMAFPFMIAQKYLSTIREDRKMIKDISKEEIIGLIGDSYVEWGQIHDQILHAGNMLLNAEKKNLEGKRITVKIPLDHGVVKDGSPHYVDRLDEGMIAGDIGIKTLDDWRKEIRDAHTILLAGPVGVYENKLFSYGSKGLVEAIAGTTKEGTVTIAAGGDTAEMVRAFGYGYKFSLVSIGGGATLEFLMNGYLPALLLLDTKEKIKSLMPVKFVGG